MNDFIINILSGNMRRDRLNEILPTIVNHLINRSQLAKFATVLRSDQYEVAFDLPLC